MESRSLFSSTFGGAKIRKRIESILPLVQKPARYTGGELNSVVKDKWEVVQILGMKKEFVQKYKYNVKTKRICSVDERPFPSSSDLNEKSTPPI